MESINRAFAKKYADKIIPLKFKNKILQCRIVGYFYNDQSNHKINNDYVIAENIFSSQITWWRDNSKRLSQSINFHQTAELTNIPYYFFRLDVPFEQVEYLQYAEIYKEKLDFEATLFIDHYPNNYLNDILELIRSQPTYKGRK